MVKGNSLNDETLNADAVMDEEMEKNHFVLAWNHICSLKHLGGASILTLYEHMMARWFTFIRFMFEGVQPLTKMAT